MANMSYCRFENTIGDFHDCLANFDKKASTSEHDFRVEMAELIADIAFQFESRDEFLDWANELPVDD
jgi:hypothetical protein